MSFSDGKFSSVILDGATRRHTMTYHHSHHRLQGEQDLLKSLFSRWDHCYHWGAIQQNILICVDSTFLGGAQKSWIIAWPTKRELTRVSPEKYTSQLGIIMALRREFNNLQNHISLSPPFLSVFCHVGVPNVCPITYCVCDPA